MSNPERGRRVACRHFDIGHSLFDILRFAVLRGRQLGDRTSHVNVNACGQPLDKLGPGGTMTITG
jgi:hypothetical protein